MVSESELRCSFNERFTLSLLISGPIEQECIYISIGKSDILIDFTQTQIYWKRMKKNINTILLGPQNYKQGKRGHKYNFSKCLVNHNMDTVFTTLLGRHLTSTDDLNLVQNFGWQVTQVFEPLFLYNF